MRATAPRLSLSVWTFPIQQTSTETLFLGFLLSARSSLFIPDFGDAQFHLTAPSTPQRMPPKEGQEEQAR
jgi:hypothetical protein